MRLAFLKDAQSASSSRPCLCLLRRHGDKIVFGLGRESLKSCHPSSMSHWVTEKLFCRSSPSARVTIHRNVGCVPRMLLVVGDMAGQTLPWAQKSCFIIIIMGDMSWQIDATAQSTLVMPAQQAQTRL